MGIKPGPKRIAKSTGKPDRRQRDNKETPGNTSSLKPHIHKKGDWVILEMRKRETDWPLFFVCGLPQHARQAYHFVGYVWVLCAFFVAILKPLKTNRIQETAYKVHKMLIYSTIIGWSLGDLPTVCRRSAYQSQFSSACICIKSISSQSYCWFFVRKHNNKVVSA